MCKRRSAGAHTTAARVGRQPRFPPISHIRGFGTTLSLGRPVRLTSTVVAAAAALLVTATSSPGSAAPRGTGSATKARRPANAADKLIAEGRWVEASALLRSEADDPSRNAAARKKAGAALDALEKRMPHVTLEIPPTFKGSIAVDGAPIEVAKWPAPIALDPGEHVVTTRVGLAAPVRYPVTLRERERHVLALADEPTTSPSTAPAPRESARSESSPWRTVGFVGVGAGLLTLGAGGVLAVMASNEKTALEGRCPNDICPESARSDFDSGRAKANFATFALAGGAVLTAASVALVVFGPQKKEDSRVELRAGAAGVSLKGRFQ